MYQVVGQMQGGEPYQVTVADTAAAGDPHGLVALGSANVVDLLAGRTGEQVAATPVGPFMPLDLTDPRAVLAALRQHTTVLTVTGAPPTLTDAPADAVL